MTNDGLWYKKFRQYVMRGMDPDEAHKRADLDYPKGTITVGFSFTAICFPLRERGNWLWGRESNDQLFAVGPFRFGFRRRTAER